MAITDPYATAAQYRTSISKSSTGDDTIIGDQLTMMSRYLDGRIGRHFTKDASAVARPFIRQPLSDPRRLYVHDLAAAPTEIIVDTDNDGSFADETAISSANWELWPLNAALGPEPHPWTSILLPAWSSEGEWPAGVRVRVTAQFGWPSVPVAVREACIELTSIFRMQSPRATNRVEEMGAVVGASRESQTLVSELIERYARVERALGFA
jgi:hypothetical protein